jgi:flagellar motor switch protein FliG
MADADVTDLTDAEITERMTGTQKSAILMMLLGEEEAAEILKNLSPREVQHLGGAMYAVRNTNQQAVNAVLDEFLAIIKKQTSLGLGAGNYIRNILNRALGEDYPCQ